MDPDTKTRDVPDLNAALATIAVDTARGRLDRPVLRPVLLAAGPTPPVPNPYASRRFASPTVVPPTLDEVLSSGTDVRNLAPRLAFGGYLITAFDPRSEYASGLRGISRAWYASNALTRALLIYESLPATGETTFLVPLSREARVAALRLIVRHAE